MKKMRVYMFIMFSMFSLTACAPKSAAVVNTENQVVEQKLDEKFDISKNMTQFLNNNKAVASIKHKDMFCDDTENIYYSIDGKIKKFNKKTAQEDTLSNCANDVQQIILNKNNLYFVNHKDSYNYQIYLYDLKNSSEKVVKSFHNEYILGIKIFIQNNFLFCAVDSSINPMENSCRIIKINLDSNKEEVIKIKNNDGALINKIILDNNNLYYTTNCGELCKYNIDTNKKTILFKFNKNITFNDESNILKVKDKLVYFDNENKLMSISENGGQPQQITKDRAADIVTTNNKIYFSNIDNKRKLYSVDCDGNNIQLIDKDSLDIFRDNLFLFEQGIGSIVNVNSKYNFVEL